MGRNVTLTILVDLPGVTQRTEKYIRQHKIWASMCLFIIREHRRYNMMLSILDAAHSESVGRQHISMQHVASVGSLKSQRNNQTSR